METLPEHWRTILSLLIGAAAGWLAIVIWKDVRESRRIKRRMRDFTDEE